MANLPALTPTTFGEAVQFAEALAKSTMVPREYQRMPANILVAIQWGAELGLGPLQALQNIAVINGKPSVYGDAMLALVRGSPHCEDIVEHIEGEGDNRTAICEARRKGSVPVVGRFSVADAKRAGLWDKAGPWKQYPARMLQMRARGFALRDAFPDILRGVISAEEAGDRPMKDVTPDPAVLSAELDNFAAASDVAPDQAETDPLLAAARAQALNGRDAFRQWYRDQLDNEQRAGLRPHMDELRVTATRIDDTAAPPHPDGRPDRSRENPAVPPAVDAPTPESAPTDVEIESALPEAVELEVIKPKRGKGDRGWDWPKYADEMIAAAHRLPTAELGRFRGANSSMIEVCRTSDRDQWERLHHALADYEREGAA
jgi:hypothetical protein